MRVAPAQSGLLRFEAFFAGHAYDLHRHDSYAVGFTLSGVQSFDYRGARADSTAGKVIVLYPDEAHDGHAGAEAGFRYRMLYLAPRLVRAALGPNARSLPFVREAVSTDGRLLRALRLVLDDLDRPLEPLEMDRAILEIASALAARDRSPPSRPVTVDAHAIEQASEILDAHFDRVVSAEELEAATGLDRYTLARQFRTRLGTSPYRYLVMRRLERARSLIRAGRPLAEGALASGFFDQSHLTRRFKQAFGILTGTVARNPDLRKRGFQNGRFSTGTSSSSAHLAATKKVQPHVTGGSGYEQTDHVPCLGSSWPD